MITWKTSRLLLLVFLLLLSVIGIAASTMVEVDTLARWRSQVARIGESALSETSVTPAPLAGLGQAARLPRYPAVIVVPPSVSIFDPAV